MGYEHDLTNKQKSEFGRFAYGYIPDWMNNNLGHRTDATRDLDYFDPSVDGAMRAVDFGRDSGLCKFWSDLGVTSDQWYAVLTPPAETTDSTYGGIDSQRCEISRYMMKRVGNLQGERVMLESMGIDTEKGAPGFDRRDYTSFADMINDPDNRRLRPTEAEIARFEELTSFNRNDGSWKAADHDASGVRGRLRVPEQNREAFEEFRDKFLADRGLEYDPMTKSVEKEGTAAQRDAEMSADRDVPSQTQSFSQGFGGMADSFVAQHDAQQATQHSQFGVSAGRTATHDGPEFG